MNIIEAIKDEHLFRPFLADDNGSIKTWRHWLGALRTLYGLPIPQARQDVVRQCTGRDIDQLPKDGFDTALFLCGRRSGKSRMSAVIGAYEGVLAGHESKLSKGEKGLVGIFSPTRRQSQNVKNYLRAIFNTDLLRNEVVDETRDGFTLKNGNMIEILAGDFRVVRGFTLIAAIVDEAAFLGVDEDSRIKSDAELITALEPGLATTGGKLIAITTPYARKGWCYSTFQKHHGNNNGAVLVWNSPSRTMNETLPQRVVDKAYAEDMAKAKAEFGGEFRDDVGAYISRAVVEALVVKGRTELLPNPSTRYFAFADMASGTAGGDDACLAIAHCHGRTVVVDLLHRHKPPFNPYEVIAKMAEDIKRFNIRQVVGDHWSPGFVAGAFKDQQLRYEKAEHPKSILYANLLPRLCSSQIELLDNDALVNQLASLERRTRSGGNDIIDHPSGGHDDLANVIAGVSKIAVVRPIKIGGAW